MTLGYQISKTQGYDRPLLKIIHELGFLILLMRQWRTLYPSNSTFINYSLSWLTTYNSYFLHFFELINIILLKIHQK
jgi:hypothetical protein